MGDESELRKLPINMVLNANDALPIGGRLTLSVEDADDSVVISIADSGSGMASEISHFPSVLHHQGHGWDGLRLAVGFGITRRHEEHSKSHQRCLRHNLPYLPTGDQSRGRVTYYSSGFRAEKASRCS